MNGESGCVLAIDPGRNKCGIAVVRRTAADPAEFEVPYRRVAPRHEIAALLSEIVEAYSPAVVLVGNGTMCDEYSRLASDLGLPVKIVDERHSTLLARKRYFQENPPRGLRRLIPVSLQCPPEPYDDCAAVILAEKFLRPGRPPEEK